MKSFDLELFSEGSFSETEEFKDIIFEVETAIENVVWHDENEFVINPSLKGNGVVPIKRNFISTLKELNWRCEEYVSVIKGVRAGPIDAIRKSSQGLFAIEWETGNVSSSHRALNKIALGVLQGNIIGGILVVPKRSLSRYLTDRIGNYEELVPYFDLYKAIHFNHGVIGILSVDYDKLDKDAPNNS